MDCKEDIILIVLAIEKRFQPERSEFSIKRVYLSLKLLPETLIVFIGIKLQKLLDIIDFANELLPWIIAVLKRIEILESLLSLLRIIPEIWSFCLLLDSFYLIFSPSLFKDASIQYRLLP